MALVYNVAAANSRMTASLLTAILGQSVDGGAAPGQLVIGTSALAGATGVLATIALVKPSFSIANKIATLLGVPLSIAAAAAGTAALAELRDSAGTTIISGLTVGTAGTNITLNSVAFGVGETITIISGTFTHP